MEGLGPLSSQVGQRTEEANREAAVRCLASPGLLVEVAQGLAHPRAALRADCAEVMTIVAQTSPALVVPYADQLALLLGETTTRVRWEAMHALALVAPLAPGVITGLLPRLGNLLDADASVIVRDYAVEALGGYAGTGAEASRLAYPYLKCALTAGEGKQAGRALTGLAQVAVWLPELHQEIRSLAQPYLDRERGVVRKAARQVIRSLQ